jgi:glycerol-3-phosphate acyltransferase PlsX
MWKLINNNLKIFIDPFFFAYKRRVEENVLLTKTFKEYFDHLDPSLCDVEFYYPKYAEEVLGIKNPKLGLINIGTEQGKGRSLDKEAANLFIQNKALNFYGNVEPKDVLNPPVDILISDGFTANIVMKTIEVTAKGMGAMLKQELKKGFFGKLGLLLSAGNLKRFKKRMSPSEIGGAMIMGLRGVVIKAQGASKSEGFANAIVQASNVVRQDVINKVSSRLGEDA